MSNTFTDTSTMVARECSCGVRFAVTQDFETARRKDHKTFYCPNGCSRWFPQKNELELATARAERLENERNAARETAAFLRRSRAALQGHQTRLKRHIANGQCPCCKKEFKDVARHMARQHPGFESE